MALGSILLNYSNEISEEDLKKSIDLCLINLNSTLQCIRQGAAISLSNLIRVPDENEDRVKQFLEFFELGFSRTIEQVIASKSNYKNESTANNNKSLFASSCEDDIGMMIMPQQSNDAWCLADGYLYLIYEISNINKKIVKNFIIKQLDLILKLIKIRNYSQHVYIMETFCKLVIF